MERALLVVALAVSPAVSQTVHVVGGGGAFAQIRDALAVAASGDVITVHAGTYAHFDATVGVTIRALVPGAVTIAYDPAFAPPGCSTTPGCPATQGPSRFLLPAGQTAHVVGLRFSGAQVLLPPFVSPKVEVSGGRITFDQCEFESSTAEALRVDATAVHLQDCTVTGTNFFGPVVGSHGLTGANSIVTVVGGSFVGSGFGIFPTSVGSGGDGVRLNNCVFHGSGFQARGGLTLSPNPPGFGVRLSSCVGWISDAAIQGGNSTCGLTGATRAARITAPVGCPPANGSVLGVLRATPLQLGTTFTLDFRTEPNGFAAVFASPELATNTVAGFAEPAVHLDLNTLLVGGVVLANATGAATAAFAIPATPALASQPFWFQGVTGLALPLRTSAPVGGIVR